MRASQNRTTNTSPTGPGDTFGGPTPNYHWATNASVLRCEIGGVRRLLIQVAFSFLQSSAESALAAQASESDARGRHRDGM